MAVGIIFSFLAPGFTPDLSAFLCGNILTITPTDIWMLATLSVLLILFFTLFLNPIIYICLLYTSVGLRLYLEPVVVCPFRTDTEIIHQLQSQVDVGA